MKQILEETSAGSVPSEFCGEEISIQNGMDSSPLQEHSFPTEDTNNYMDKQLFPCPSEEKSKYDKCWKENNKHLSPDQIKKVEKLLRDHPDVPATSAAPLGKFKLFQISADIRMVRNATQAKRKVNFELAEPAVERMEKVGIVRRNDSNNISNICNLVIVSKTERLTKADKFELKKKNTNLAQSPTSSQSPASQATTPKMNHRITCDFSSLNTLTSTRKYISMPNINDLAAKV